MIRCTQHTWHTLLLENTFLDEDEAASKEVGVVKEDLENDEAKKLQPMLFESCR